MVGQSDLTKLALVGTLIVLGLALANHLAPRGVWTVRVGDSLTIGSEGVKMEVSEGLLVPPRTGWMYHIQIDQLTEESLRIVVTYYQNQKVNEMESGPFTIPEGPTPKKFTHFMLTVDDATPEKARITIKQVVA